MSTLRRLRSLTPAIDLHAHVARVRSVPDPAPEGRVAETMGLVVQIVGMVAAIGDQLRVDIEGRELLLEVLGFRDRRLLATPLGSTEGLRPGMRVMHRPHGSDAAVDFSLLGRVIGAFGEPLDGRPAPLCAHRAPLRALAPDPMSRPAIDKVFQTGVRAIDGLLPLGQGQRVGLFAGTGVGKSTLLGMLCKNSTADVVVVGLVGERGREVGDFVREVLGKEGLARAVVVAATSDAPPLVRVRGALRAVAIAEFFRDQGKNVLLLLDSVTRFAMALREASLAAGEPPVTKGYTPSVFAALPALLERAGTSEGGGSITAVYTVLVEGDDLNDPIADAVRGILDGHIVLTRNLAERGHYPAIDVLKSVSRLAHQLMPKDHAAAAIGVRSLLAAHRDVLDLVQIGAYAAGSDARADAALRAMPRIEAFLRQRTDEATPLATTVDLLRRVAGDAR